MRKRIVILLGLLLPLFAAAQTEVNHAPDFGGRVSVSVDKRIIRGLHVSLEERIRFNNNFGGLDRLQSTLRVTYKVHPNIKLGLGYCLINDYNIVKHGFMSPRHRFIADVKGTLKLNKWNISLMERLQLTHRTGDINVYQFPTNVLILKSRLTAKYLGFRRIEPYAYLEMRNLLNAPVISAAFDGVNYGTIDGHLEESDPGWFLEGFNGSYMSRWRGSLGVDIKLDRRNTLSVFILNDYCIDKEVDANAEGTILRSYTIETIFRCWIGAGYEYAF